MTQFKNVVKRLQLIAVLYIKREIQKEYFNKFNL